MTVKPLYVYLTNVGSRRRVTIGYVNEEGKVERVYRKIDAYEYESIQLAIDQLREDGHQQIVAEIFRPNGTAEKVAKCFLIESDDNITPINIAKSNIANMSTLPETSRKIIKKANSNSEIQQDDFQEMIRFTHHLIHNMIEPQKEEIASLRNENQNQKKEIEQLREFELKAYEAELKIQRLNVIIEDSKKINPGEMLGSIITNPLVLATFNNWLSPVKTPLAQGVPRVPPLKLK